MSDTEMTQEQKDAATLATIREFMDITKDHDKAQGGHSVRDGTRAMLRTIDAQAAELAQLRAKAAAYDALRAACDGVPEMLKKAIDRNCVHVDYPWGEVYDEYAQRLAAALAAPADGAPDGSADAADGSEGAGR
jgi:hypothetical protein